MERYEKSLILYLRMLGSYLEKVDYNDMGPISYGLQVFTWGHRLVSPRRVVISRNVRKIGNTAMKFHRKERLNVVAIAAGMTHSLALTDDGALFYWTSPEPDLHCHQVFLYSMKLLLFFLFGFMNK